MIVYLAILVAFGAVAVAHAKQRHRLDDAHAAIDALRAQVEYFQTEPREISPRRRVSRTGPI